MNAHKIERERQEPILRHVSSPAFRFTSLSLPERARGQGADVLGVAIPRREQRRSDHSPENRKTQGSLINDVEPRDGGVSRDWIRHSNSTRRPQPLLALRPSLVRDRSLRWQTRRLRDSRRTDQLEGTRQFERPARGSMCIARGSIAPNFPRRERPLTRRPVSHSTFAQITDPPAGSLLDLCHGVWAPIPASRLPPFPIQPPLSLSKSRAVDLEKFTWNNVTHA
jgi:hypothetical protein